MTHLEYGDQVLVNGEECTVLGLWPDRVLVMVKRNSDDLIFSVLASSATKIEHFECEGCGEEMTPEGYEVFHLCRSCDYEREAENAADQRAER